MLCAVAWLWSTRQNVKSWKGHMGEIIVYCLDVVISSVSEFGMVGESVWVAGECALRVWITQPSWYWEHLPHPLSWVSSSRWLKAVNCSLLQPTPVILLKEGTDSSQGIPQLVSNISACQVIAEAVRTTLGPRGMDKLIVDGRGKSSWFLGALYRRMGT